MNRKCEGLSYRSYLEQDEKVGRNFVGHYQELLQGKKAGEYS
jgi:hypothetical protein